MLLRTAQLTKDYGRHRALDGVSFGVAAGEVFGLLGPNGSGKSTALRLLLGFLRPTAGSASIAGHDCWHDSVAARRHVTYLPGELRLYENMTGRQLIRFLGRLRGQPASAELPELARQFDIDLDRPIAHLSSGMKRKVALLQVLVPHAPLLVLDEPTNTLDPTMRQELLGQLRRARDHGQAVLFSSHVLGEVEQVCDRVGILQKGRLVHVQNMSELRQARLIRARFSQDPAVLPDLPGVHVRPREDHQLELEHSGPLPPLLDWLSRQPVTELQMEPLGLSAIYQRYHGVET
ncbi:MAG TPA: ABC transporter ATP-binding protein [Gemmataceae bacterium]|jgi:ABC-2 type transport system ATP-binding protein|nr:ABC transporter ATP-binding protein [Gemmataceae bacterium]